MSAPFAKESRVPVPSFSPLLLSEFSSLPQENKKKRKE